MSKKNKIIFLILLFLFPVLGISQDSFTIDNQKDVVKIPFKLINNLIFIPIKVNGVELNFVLDSGVEETILFSLEDKKDVNFFNVQKISLRGLGSEDAIEGLKSTNNILESNGFVSKNHVFYIILDQSFNLSSHVGIPVNGIIGYKFFKNSLIKIDYLKHKIFVYRDNKNISKITEKYIKIPITIEKSKPYLNSLVTSYGETKNSKLLIDIGNSDAIWLFQNDSLRIPEKKFEDFLGKGFSGDILGYRGKVEKFSINTFEFENPLVAFPDTTSTRHVGMVPGRVGSVGGEILRRFSVIIDYPNSALYLKKNKTYKEPFLYNKSGISVQHNGLQWVKGVVTLQTEGMHGEKTIHLDHSNQFKYKFELKPVFEIAHVRKNSPAEKAGLRNEDTIITINNKSVTNYSLQKISALLKSEDDKWITIEVDRKGQILKFRFELVDML